MRKLACIGRECVACGACAKACPLKAVAIDRGLIAVVDAARCAGCGKCALACPAGVIEILAREEAGA